MFPNLFNRIIASVTQYNLVLVSHTINAKSNKPFPIKEKTYGFFNKEQLEDAIYLYKRESEVNNFVADSANAQKAMLRGWLTPNVKFQRGASINDITYICYSEFYGEKIPGDRFPQEYEVTIHPDFKKYFAVKNS